MSTLIIFIQKAIAQGIGMLFGATGEIITEKSGNLNLGVPGLMYMGGIAGLMGAFVYENGTENPIGIVGVIISMLCALIASGLGALIYSVLTITLRANQNVTGLALTTFGVGFGNFFGGSLSQLAGGVGLTLQALDVAVGDIVPCHIVRLNVHQLVLHQILHLFHADCAVKLLALVGNGCGDLGNLFPAQASLTTHGIAGFGNCGDDLGNIKRNFCTVSFDDLHRFSSFYIGAL